MAEHVVRRHFAEEGLDVEVDSSGTDGWHVGDPADHRTVRTLSRHGYTSAHTARRFSPSWFARYDLVVALDQGHAKALRSLASTPEEREKIRLLRSFDPQAADLDVPDPYYGGDADFEECLELIEAAVPGILAEVRGA